MAGYGGQLVALNAMTPSELQMAAAQADAAQTQSQLAKQVAPYQAALARQQAEIGELSLRQQKLLQTYKNSLLSKKTQAAPVAAPPMGSPLATAVQSAQGTAPVFDSRLDAAIQSVDPADPAASSKWDEAMTSLMDEVPQAKQLIGQYSKGKLEDWRSMMGASQMRQSMQSPLAEMAGEVGVPQAQVSPLTGQIDPDLEAMATIDPKGTAEYLKMQGMLRFQQTGNVENLRRFAPDLYKELATAEASMTNAQKDKVAMRSSQVGQAANSVLALAEQYGKDSPEVRGGFNTAIVGLARDGIIPPEQARQMIEKPIDFSQLAFYAVQSQTVSDYMRTSGKEAANIAAAKPEYRSVKNADGSESIIELGADKTPTRSFNGSGAQIESAALEAVPGAIVTSRARSAAHNAAVGGVANSYHLTDQARDFVPPNGMSLAQLSDKLKGALPGYDVIKEKDHVHVEPAPSASFNESGTKVVFTSKGNPGGAQGNAPSGYRFKSDGTLEAIPGGPADVDKLPQEAVVSMAQQYLAGDKSVLQGLGRGAQGSAAIAQVRAEIGKQAKALGMSGRDIAAQMADFAGVTAAARATGTRIANVELASTEAQKLIPLALAASAALPRNGFLPFSRAEQALQSGVNNPALRKFVTANTALVNVYSRAVSPTGAPTVSDKEHARELLDTAYDQASYKAVVDQMQAEIAAARAAPGDVRREIRESVGGNTPGHTAAPPAATAAIPPGAQPTGKFYQGKPVYIVNGRKWVP